MTYTVTHPAAKACYLLEDGTLAGWGPATVFPGWEEALVAVLRTCRVFGFDPASFSIVPLGDAPNTPKRIQLDAERASMKTIVVEWVPEKEFGMAKPCGLLSRTTRVLS